MSFCLNHLTDNSFEMLSDQENDLQTSDYFSESTPKSCKSIELDHKYALSPTYSLFSNLSTSSDTCLTPINSNLKPIIKQLKRRKLFGSQTDINRQLISTPLSERKQLAIALQLSSKDTNCPSVDSFNPNKSLFSTNDALKSVTQRVKRNHKGETGLHIAAIKGDINRVKQIITENKYPIDSIDFAGWAPIHEACNRGHIDIVEELLKAGSDVNARGYNGDTPLIDAAINGHFSLVELLLEYGADYTLRNNSNRSAVELTKSAKVFQIISIFIEEKMRKNGVTSKDNVNKSRSSSPSNNSPLKPSSPRLTLRFQSIKDSKQTSSVTNTTTSGPSMASTKSYSVSTGSDKELNNDLSEKLNENNNNKTNGNTTESVSASTDHNYTSVDSSLTNPSDESSRGRKRRKSNDGSVSSTSTTGGPSPRSGSSSSNTSSNQSNSYNNKKHHNQSPHHSHHHHSSHSNKSKDSKDKNSKKLFSSSSDSDGIEGSECDKDTNPKDSTSNGTPIVVSNETTAPKVPPLRIVLPVNSSNTTSSSNASTTSNAGTHSSLSSNVTSSTTSSGAKFPYVVPSEESLQSESECVSGAVSSQRITRSSQRVAQQQSQKSGTTSMEHQSDSEESGLHTSHTDSQHPRKRKIRNNNNLNDSKSNANNNNNGSNGDNDNDSSSSTSSVNLNPKDISPFALPQTNCYQMFLSIRKNVDKKRREMYSVPPKAPQGFDDYMINQCSYNLADNRSNKITKPSMATPPSSLSGSRMHDVFIEQEKERHKLRVQHLIERQKLILSSEQEILRVHGRAARAMANQNVPFSVCSILKDEEIYNIFDSESEQNDNNISNQIKSDKGLTAGSSGLSANRTRYNGRLFLSWLQDVSDKWEKTKKLMVLRHKKESESLLAMQRLEWEWKLKEFALCDLKTSPAIDDKHVPKVNVSETFEQTVE